MLQDLEIPNDNSNNNNNDNDNNNKPENYDESSNGAPIASIDLNDSSSQSSQNSEEETSTSLACGESKPQAAASSSNTSGVVDDFSLMLKHTLDGFLLILANDGDITYVTANIADYLGISKVNRNVWNYF